MARLEGGIFSRPRGKTGGVVFGAARTREGKQVTSRLLVSPSNPNTAAQQAQRGIFSYALWIVRKLGAAIYQVAWNRSVSQLPGFQSLMSICMNNITSAGVFNGTPGDTNLGTLTMPADMAAATGSGSGEVDLSWSTDFDEGNASDTLTILCIDKIPDVGEVTRDIQVITTPLRSAGSYTITGLEAGGDYRIAVYFEGASGESDEGLYSPAHWMGGEPHA